MPTVKWNLVSVPSRSCLRAPSDFGPYTRILRAMRLDHREWKDVSSLGTGIIYTNILV